MRTLRLAAASLLIAVLGVGAWAAVYAYDKGFSKKWRRLIMAEFDRRGIEAEIGKLTIDPIEGLVARDVRIFADDGHRSVVASMDNITLDIDFAKMLRKEQFLNTVEFRDADISFPIDPDDPGGERLEIKNFSARIRVPTNKIEIDRAECDFHGIRITMAGSLLQPKPRRDADDTDQLRRQLELMRQRRAVFARVVAEIEKFHLDPDAPPHLHLEVIGDLDKPASIEATAKLTGTDVGRGTYYCNSLEVRAEYRHPNLLIDQIKLTDDYGELYADAHWRAGTENVPFNVESSIDSHSLLRSVFETNSLGEVVFFDPPRLGAAGEFYLGARAEGAKLPLKLVGTFECNRFSSRGGLIFEGAYAEFSVDPKRWYVRNLSLEHQTGSGAANALYDSETGIRYNAEIDMDPTIFIPLFQTEQTQEFLGRFEFDKKNPIISVGIAGSGPSLDQRLWTNKGQFTLGACTYREIPVLNATGSFEIRGKDMKFRDFRIHRPEGHIDGDYVHVRGDEQLVEVHNVRGKVFPAGVAGYFAPKTAATLSRYQFLTPPEVTLNGTIDSGRRYRHDFVATFKSGDAASFPIFKRALPLAAPAGTVELKGEDLGLDVTAGLFGGRADYRGTLGMGTKRGEAKGDLTTRDIDFGQLAELYELPTETKGLLNGSLAYHIPSDDRRRWSGTARATLREGDVFAIPVMGPISRLISTVLDRPRAGYSIATEASASFQIERGVIRSEDFVANTPGFVLRAKGYVDPVEDRMEIDAEMNARGPLRIVGWPISKLLRYRGEGALSDPQWRAVNFTLPRRDGTAEVAAGDGPLLPDVVTAVPKAVGTGARATVGVGAKALGTGAKVLGTGTRGAVELGSKARDLIPLPRVLPRPRSERATDGEEEPFPRPAPTPAGGTR